MNMLKDLIFAGDIDPLGRHYYERNNSISIVFSGRVYRDVHHNSPDLAYLQR